MNELIVKYIAGEISEKERLQLFSLLESDEDVRKEFLSAVNLRAYSSWLPADDDLSEGIGKLMAFKKHHSNKHRVMRFMRYVAVACVAIFCSVVVIRKFYVATEDSIVSYEELYVPSGQRAQVKLHDGTVIWLNASSHLRYPSRFARAERKVELDGEAYFEVAHNKEIPFYVQTENIKVQVTGTKFDVCSYKGSNSFIARLIEGSINLLTNNAKEEKPITSLTKGKYFSMENGKYKTGEMSSNNALAWMQGIYYFDDVPFKELLDKIALYYNYKITVKNPKILENYRCTGKFKDLDGIEHILKVIQKDHPFKYDIDNEHNKITIE